MCLQHHDRHDADLNVELADDGDPKLLLLKGSGGIGSKAHVRIARQVGSPTDLVARRGSPPRNPAS